MAVVDDRVRAFLAGQRVARLATASATGEPHVVPICFCLVEDTLYVAIDEKPKTREVFRLRRLRNIAANPRVAVVADVYDDADWSRLGFVLLRGTARVIEVGDEHARAVGALRARYAQYQAMALEERPVIVVDVERVTTWGTLA
jgi:coenzyme F420-0:L-glutamate ligase / coenzyme F420-1:gamma-L-glutamate ligase